jgi:hypothetical protein
MIRIELTFIRLPPSIPYVFAIILNGNYKFRSAIMLLFCTIIRWIKSYIFLSTVSVQNIARRTSLPLRGSHGHVNNILGNLPIADYFNTLLTRQEEMRKYLCCAQIENKRKDKYKAKNRLTTKLHDLWSIWQFGSQSVPDIGYISIYYIFWNILHLGYSYISSFLFLPVAFLNLSWS